MSDDTECPYCGAGVEICHDDGQGYAEDVLHHQECPSCEKTFAFYTYVSFSYSPRKADCLNGSPHNYRTRWTAPDGSRHVECTVCGEERRLPKEGA